MTFLSRFLFILIALYTTYAAATPFLPGKDQQRVQIEDVTFHIYTYRPQCSPRAFLIVFHGMNRDAETYRDDAQFLADKTCSIILAPLFDKEHFPTWRYQKGGIIRRNRLVDPQDWPGYYVLKIIKWAETQEGRSLPYSLIGHSAGAQFLDRLAAFTPLEAQHVIIANPSSYVTPSLDIDAPYGMGNVYSREREKIELERYLQTPITILIGQNDVGYKHLDENDDAEDQGTTRYERGLNTFHTAQIVAKQNGWAFNWSLMVVPDVGHNAPDMLNSREALKALR